MKRFTFVAVALCLAFVMAAPTMALEADMGGTYRVRGFVDQDATTLSTAATNAHMEMRLRVQTVFKVSDNLRLTTRFDALERDWGTSDTVSVTSTAPGSAATVDNQRNVDWERVYMTFNTPIGKFDIGAMSAGSFGTLFADSNTTADRIKFTKVIDALTILAIYQKSTEADAGVTTADTDYDVYYLAPIFKAENFTVGMLYGYYVNKTKSDTGTLASNYDQTFHLFDPYITAKFGDFRLVGELQILSGDANDYTDTGGPADIDKDEMAYWLEVGYNFGAFDVEVGYAYFSGDQNGTTDNEDSAHGGFGDDWEKLHILAGNRGTIDTNLGNGTAKGNLSSTGQSVAPGYGAKLMYVGGNFAVNDQLKLGAIIGYAEADEVPANWKDEYGTEIDLKLTYKIMDNLTYSAIAAYLDTGDFWYGATSGVEPANFSEVTSFYHQIQINF